MSPNEFQNRILDWFKYNGRKNLPWQSDPTPYRVWVSEIMLQQTQVLTVIPYYLRFMESFPNVAALADAPLDSVLHHWSGLGYYARARNLHKAAQILGQDKKIPADLEKLMAIPGIGRSTAGAIMSIAFMERAAILDGNVKRVFSRFKMIDGWSGNTKVAQELWRISEYYTPQTNPRAYTQAIMDLGSITCSRTNPSCTECPVSNGCLALVNKRVSEIPTPRPRKKIPVQKRFLMVLRNSDSCFFLENRASSGRWGGLWSFPEFEHKKDLLDWCVTKNLEETDLIWLPECRHTFSHFHLDYTPVLGRLEYRQDNVLEANQKLWYNPTRNDQYGFPAPISRLLEQLSDQQD